jgi:hypothetical protein
MSDNSNPGSSQGPFGYLQPTEEQKADMERARDAAYNYSKDLHAILREGPDKTHIIRQLRTLAMWVNVAITRNADGSPRV